MGVKIRIRNGVVHLIIRSGGTTHEETTGLHTTENPIQNKEVMKLAELLRSRREIQLIEGLNGISITEGKQTLYEYAEKYSEQRGRATQIYKALPYIEAFGGRSIQIGAVTSRWFEQFQLNMEHDSGLAKNTQEKYCCVVRQILKKAVRDGILRHDPSEGIRHIRTPESVKEYLTAEEVKRMIQTECHRQVMSEDLQEDIRRGFIFSCYTGVRISDMRQLKWKNIDSTQKVIQKKQQKTQKIVTIPICEPAWRIIDDGFRNPEGYVFPFLARSKTSENRYIHQWAKLAGIYKDVTWHTARHTDATMLLEYGADLYTVKNILGHSKISTTEQYAKVTDHRRREAVNALPDFEKI